MKKVEKYIKQFPEKVQIRLNEVRNVILEAVPEVSESTAYQMPAYRLNGKVLVYFAGCKNHIGLYATQTGHTKFASELSVYKHGKGSVQFPNNQPLPLDLIKRIVIFRKEENLAKIENKKKPLASHTSDE
jgi:uncharacterized protein YdhG (YjbR/CyaY superfamily)